VAAADGARPVADLGRRGDDAKPASAGARAAAGGEDDGQQRERQTEPREGRRREDASREDGDRRSGWRVELDREPESDDSLRRRERDARRLPGRKAPEPEPRGRGRDDVEGGGEQGADGG